MSDATNGDLMYCVNGLNASTGHYLDESWTADEIVEQVQQVGQLPDKVYNDHQSKVKAQDPQVSKTWAVPPGYDEDKLDSVGWCVVFPEKGDPEVRKRLTKLLDRRRQQAGALYSEYGGERGSDFGKAVGYQAGETWDQFRARYRVQLGLAQPREMPYYVLLVGSPQEIPFNFQYEIDVHRAVGRIHFDTPQEYACYAESVVAAEDGKVSLPRQTVFFGTHNSNDRNTELSAKHLVTPLISTNLRQPNYQDLMNTWNLQQVLPAEATKPKLRSLIGGTETPALLFSATHGAGFLASDANRQRTRQGALVCQEWPGPRDWGQALPDDFFVSACDIGSDASVWGLIAVFFACFSAGTPRRSDFIHRQNRDPRERDVVAEQASVSPLAQRLLAHPNGGALAVIGHVERAWPTSFVDQFSDNSPSVGAFEILLASLMQDHRLGYAMEAFNLRYAEISTKLSLYLWNVDNKRETLNPERVAGMWTTNNDARNYVVIGDPAVKLAAAPAGATVQRESFPYVYAQPIPLQVACEQGAVASNGGQGAKVAAQKPAQTTGAATASGAQSDTISDADLQRPFLPLFEPPPDFDTDKYPDLYTLWVEHIKGGYKNFDAVFRHILRAFLISHFSTLVMNWILFSVGVGFFVAACVAGLRAQSLAPAALFGGLSIVTFLTYFVSRPTQSVEENLNFITWLGLIYNSYWARQLAATDPATVQDVLKKSTDDAIAQIKELVERHAQAVRERPGLKQGLLGAKDQKPLGDQPPHG